MVVSIYAYTQDAVPEQSGQVLGALLDSSGSVQFRHESYSFWVNVGKNQKFVDGNIVSTGPQSKANVMFISNRVLEIGPDTQVALSMNDLDKGTADGKGGYLVNVLKGSLRVKEVTDEQRKEATALLQAKSFLQGGSNPFLSMLGLKKSDSEEKAVLKSGNASLELGSSKVDVSIDKVAGEAAPTIKVKEGQATVQNLDTGLVSELKSGGLMEAKLQEVALNARAPAEDDISSNMPRLAPTLNKSVFWTFLPLKDAKNSDLPLEISVASRAAPSEGSAAEKAGSGASPNSAQAAPRQILVAAAGTLANAPRQVFSATASATEKADETLKMGLPSKVYLKVASLESGSGSDKGIVASQLSLRLKAGRELARSDGKMSFFEPLESTVKLRSFKDVSGSKVEVAFRDVRVGVAGVGNRTWYQQAESSGGFDVAVTVFSKSELPRLAPLFAGSGAFQVRPSGSDRSESSDSNEKSAGSVAAQKNTVTLLKNGKPLARLVANAGSKNQTQIFADLLGADLAIQGREDVLVPTRELTSQLVENLSKQGLVTVLVGNSITRVSAKLLLSQPAALKFLNEKTKAVFRQPVDVIPLTSRGREP